MNRKRYFQVLGLGSFIAFLFLEFRYSDFVYFRFASLFVDFYKYYVVGSLPPQSTIFKFDEFGLLMALIILNYLIAIYGVFKVNTRLILISNGTLILFWGIICFLVCSSKFVQNSTFLRSSIFFWLITIVFFVGSRIWYQKGNSSNV